MKTLKLALAALALVTVQQTLAEENSTNATNSAAWVCTATDGITTWWWSHYYLNVAQANAIRVCQSNTGNSCWLMGCQ